MKVTVGNSYKIIVDPSRNGNLLTYTTTVTDEDADSITFVDRFGHKFTYNKNVIVSIEEVSNGN
jgi:hypothetical protein